ncbi:ABC transporter substrate-binding protein [Streptomyces sp. NPDC008159]|uniref:ABC transporter substrate-binding protein n=1 Tax=Streptomyces sp. NPDC008159 TaxID=3364817 RepID=UPI0036ED712D
MKNATIGAAVLGGYLLGRTKKAKLALSAGALLAGSKARPGQLAGLLDSPFLNNVAQQVRGELTEAGKAAATSVLTAKADSLAGALHERTEGLRQRSHPDGGESKGDDERTEPDDEQDEQEDEQQDEQEEKAQDEPDAESGGDDEDGEDGEDGESGGKSRPAAKRSRSGGGSQRRSTASRAKKQTASAGRAKSGSGSRSRRQDDG